MKASPEELRAVLRSDFYAFIQRSFYELNPGAEFLGNWHIELIAAELERCRKGETKRLIINVPPRSLKSICASVAFPAWMLGHNPSAQIICASYAQDLANKHSMDCRSLVSAEWYQQLFQTRLSPEKQSLQEFVTTQRGSRLATSVGGVLTGRGADIIIVDDALKPEEALSEAVRRSVNDWFDHTLCTRLNDKRDGTIILIMQRLHQDDLVGHVLELGRWQQLKLPAIAERDEEHDICCPYGVRTVTRKAGEALHPEREPLSVLQELRQTLGEYNFAGQYQQEPAPVGGGMVKAEWFKTYTAADLPESFELRVQSWDSANKVSELSDFSVCTTWGIRQKKIYLLHVFRRRTDYPELKRAVADQARLHHPNVILIEDKASGTQLIQELIRDGVHGIARYVPKMDKVLRLHSVTNTIENGLVYLPARAPWLAEYIHELITFPKARFDDQADSTSQALDWIKQRAVEPALLTFTRREVRRMLVAQGRLDDVRGHDLKYPQDAEY